MRTSYVAYIHKKKERCWITKGGVTKRVLHIMLAQPFLGFLSVFGFFLKGGRKGDCRKNFVRSTAGHEYSVILLNSSQ